MRPVMAILLGQRIEYVSLDIEGDSHLYRPSAAYDAREGDVAAQVAGYEIDAKVALAGPLAQLISRPSRNDRAAQAVHSHEEDFAQATNATTRIALLMAGEPLPELAPGERLQLTLSGATAAAVENNYHATLDRLQREAKSLLLEHWPKVKRVAKALFVRDRLDHTEVERLMAGGSIDQPDDQAA
jgi:hypothetical protein